MVCKNPLIIYSKKCNIFPEKRNESFLPSSKLTQPGSTEEPTGETRVEKSSSIHIIRISKGLDLLESASMETGKNLCDSTNQPLVPCP